MEKRKFPMWIPALVIFLVLVVIGAMMFPIIPPTTVEELPVFENVEEPLVKTSNLTLKPGEEYIYSYYTTEEDKANMTFFIKERKGCHAYVYTSDAEISVGVCLDRYGNDKTGSNVSYSDPYIYMFRPWMLAVHENWEWDVHVYGVKNESRTHLFDITYRTLRIDNINGRPAYVVEINTGEGLQTLDWIDVEKRIMVREEALGTTIELVEMPN